MKKIHLIIIVAVLLLTGLLAAMLLKPSTTAHAHDEAAEHAEHQDEAKPTPESAHDDNTVHLTATQRQQAGIQLASAQAATLQQSQRFAGEVKLNTDREAHVSTPMTGRVEAVQVQLGQTVQRGQPLATLWMPELVDLQQAVSTSKAALDLAHSQYQREKTLWQQGIAAQQDYLQAEHNWQQARITWQAAVERLQGYGQQSLQGNGRWILRAPMAGMITSKDLSVGEMVQPSRDLLTISQLDALWVEFAVPVSAANSIQMGAPVRLAVTNQPPLSGRVLTYSSSADPQTRQLLVRASIDQTAAWLKPNLWLEVWLDTPNATVPLAVKRDALLQLDGQDVVFVAMPDPDQADTLQFRPQAVTLGAQDDTWVEIRTGLSAGQSYAVSGSFALKSELEKAEAGHEH